VSSQFQLELLVLRCTVRHRTRRKSHGALYYKHTVPAALGLASVRQSDLSHLTVMSHFSVISQTKRTHGTTKLHAMDSGKVSLGQVSLLRCNIPRLLRDADGLASRRSYPKYRSSRCRLTRSYTFQKTPSLASFHREPLCLMHCRPSGRTQPSSSYSIGNFFGH